MINISDLHYAYKRSKPLFQALDFSLDKGNIVCLLGKNGEGKTTLLKLLAGHLLSQKGKITIEGYDVKRRQPELIRRIFLLLDEMRPFSCTLRQYFDAFTPMYPNYSEAVADDLIQQFQLSWKDNLKSLSMGQRKKAYIALALSVRTPLLMMDEPTNGLDIPSKAVFRKMMTRYISEDQLVIISTHQARDLEQAVDYVVALLDNKIVCNKSIADIQQVLHFGEITPENKSQALYEEMALPRSLGVFPVINSDDASFFSLELFFNALITTPEIVNHLNRI